MEGYMDVIALHQAGIENVVSSSGTALTVEQIKLIKRLTENVTILFDGDSAGIKASFRSIDMLLSEAMNIRVLLFPDGDDPDSFSRKHPQEYVENFIKCEAKDFIDFKAEILLKDAGSDPIKKAESIRDIVKSVAFVQNSLKQEVYLKEVSAKFGISEQSLFNELNVQKQINNQNRKHEVLRKETERPFKLKIEPPKSFKGDESLMMLEEKLIDSMLRYGDQIITLQDAENRDYKTTVIEEILNHFDQDNYTIISPTNSKIVKEIRDGLNDNILRVGNFFLKLLDQEELTLKATNAIIQADELSNWETKNIHSVKLGDRTEKQVQDDILIHKSHFLRLLVREIKNNLDMDNIDYYDKIKEIMILNNLYNLINKELNRNPVNEPFNL